LRDDPKVIEELAKNKQKPIPYDEGVAVSQKIARLQATSETFVPSYGCWFAYNEPMNCSDERKAPLFLCIECGEGCTDGVAATLGQLGEGADRPTSEFRVARV